jgi:deoxyribodipyrimidine photo-lyase
MWFRRDLRLTDNQAFFESCLDGAQVLPIFIIDPWFYSWDEVGRMRVRFMFECLADLGLNLQKRGNTLVVLEGNSREVLKDLRILLQREHLQPSLFFNRDVQTEYGMARDREVVQDWQESGQKCKQMDAYFLLKEENQMNQWRSNYYVYQKAKTHQITQIQSFDSHVQNVLEKLNRLNFQQLTTKYQSFWEKKSELFKGGQTQAVKILNEFLDDRYYGYHWKLSRPFLAQRGATSQLSPHLMFGTISPRQVYQTTKAKMAGLPKNSKNVFSLGAFLDRVRWRDSFTQRFWFHPEYTWRNRFAEFDSIHGSDIKLTEVQTEYFEKWKLGQTGFPLIDASMRQLRAQGWINFRMRAMCATFLTINCGISWQLGAKHYMNYLVDGDMCIDSWQWQMQAGITNPLSLTFRIYNPAKNLIDKDPDLKYVKYWLPELGAYSLAEIKAGKYLTATNYPAPMLDFNYTRLQNGQIVSDLRKAVRQRLLSEQGLELQAAQINLETVQKFQENRQKRLANTNMDSLFEEGTM